MYTVHFSEGPIDLTAVFVAVSMEWCKNISKFKATIWDFGMTSYDVAMNVYVFVMSYV